MCYGDNLHVMFVSFIFLSCAFAQLDVMAVRLAQTITLWPLTIAGPGLTLGVDMQDGLWLLKK